MQLWGGGTALGRSPGAAEGKGGEGGAVCGAAPRLWGSPCLWGSCPLTWGSPLLNVGLSPPSQVKCWGMGGGGSHQGAGGLRVGVGRGGVPELGE